MIVITVLTKQILQNTARRGTTYTPLSYSEVASEEIRNIYTYVSFHLEVTFLRQLHCQILYFLTHSMSTFNVSTTQMEQII